MKKEKTIFKIRDLRAKLLLTGIYIVIIATMYFLKIPCIYRYLFNIECPGCGMTRAALSVLSLDFVTAFKYHPMFWSVPVAYLYFLFDGRLFKNKIIDRTILIFIAAGFVANWFFKLIL